MPFTLHIAADIYGSKVNLEIEFPSLPTLSELNSVIQNSFSNECVVLRPPGASLQNFLLGRVQIYVEAEGNWRDVVSPTQLSEYAQLYVIQADPKVQESQQQIMPARRPSRPPIFPTAPPPPATPLSPVVHRNVSPSRSRVDAVPSMATPQSALRGRTSSPTVLAAQPSPAGGRHNSPSRNVTSTPLRTVVSAAPTSISDLQGSTAAQSLPARIPLPSEASTPQEKIRFVFDEMDLNGNRVIEIEEFRQVLRTLNVDFTPATVTDLFRKADRDRDGVLSISEFSNFFSSYSTLLDALFFRLRDVIEARNHQRDMNEEKAALDAARERRAHAQQTVAEAARLVEQQLKKLSLLDLERTQKQQREREVRAYLAEGDAELEGAKREVHTRESDVAQSRANEESRKMALSDARQRAQESEREVALENAQLAAAQDKERQLHQLLLEAQAQTARFQQQVQGAQISLARSRDHEANAFQALADAQKELQWAQDRLANAEREALLKSERQKELRGLLDEVQMEISRLIHRIDDEQRDTEACRERERNNQILLADADAATVAQESRLLVKDQEIVEFNKRRAAMEQQERPLLEQEVRLREQRDTLEEKEGRLRSDAGSHFEGPRTGYRSLSPVRR
jgi:hypothetical protein